MPSAGGKLPCRLSHFSNPLPVVDPSACPRLFSPTCMQSKNISNAQMLAHTSNPSAPGAEAGRWSQVQRQPGRHKEFQGSPGTERDPERPCLGGGVGTHFQISYGRVLNSLFQHLLPNRVPSAITSQSPLSFPITLLLHAPCSLASPHSEKCSRGSWSPLDCSSVLA